MFNIPVTMLSGLLSPTSKKILIQKSGSGNFKNEKEYPHEYYTRLHAK